MNGLPPAVVNTVVVVVLIVVDVVNPLPCDICECVEFTELCLGIFIGTVPGTVFDCTFVN